MSVVTPLYGSGNQPIGITLTGLGNNVQWQSNLIDNSTSLFLDCFVVLELQTTNVSTAGAVNVYAYASANGGSTFTDNLSGSNGSALLTSTPNTRILGVVNAQVASTIYVGGPFSVAGVFNGVLPQQWGIVVENKLGAQVSSTLGSAWFQGMNQQVI